MNTTGLVSAVRTGGLRVQALEPQEREMILLLAQGGTTDTVAGELKLNTRQFGHRLRKVADKLGSPTVVRSGLVYRALVLDQVEADLLEPSIQLTKKEHAVLCGVAQGRMLTRIAEDKRMEDWELGPIALQMRQKLEAADYAHAVWRGWQLQLLGPDTPGITASETRSSSQITAAGWRRRPRPARNVGAQQTPTTSPPATGVPPCTGPGAT